MRTPTLPGGRSGRMAVAAVAVLGGMVGAGVAQADDVVPIVLTVTAPSSVVVGQPLMVGVRIDADSGSFDVRTASLRLRVKVATVCGGTFDSTDGTTVIDGELAPQPSLGQPYSASLGGTQAAPTAPGVETVCAYVEQDGDQRQFANDTDTTIVVRTADAGPGPGGGSGPGGGAGAGGTGASGAAGAGPGASDSGAGTPGASSTHGKLKVTLHCKAVRATTRRVRATCTTPTSLGSGRTTLRFSLLSGTRLLRAGSATLRDARATVLLPIVRRATSRRYTLRVATTHGGRTAIHRQAVRLR